jgi:acyl-[acyl-carrier-protein]-phospholipid O-acyltransferase/long-chain-fatty-acid--[acyl-carrier-protein] ligase
MFLRQCRRSLFRLKAADSSGVALTGGRLLAGALALKRVLEREGIGRGEAMVGVLVPPSVGGVVANVALSLMRKASVNLNYTLSNDDVNYCIRAAGLKHVLTSRRAMERLGFQLDAEIVYLEDLRQKVSRFDKLLAAAKAYAWPLSLLERSLGLESIEPDDLLTVVFTSGSTGEPKGVMLSHGNILSNTLGVDQAVRIDKNDVLLGVLPFFHSFGYTGTMWLALALDPMAVYHFNPLDARQIGKLCKKYRVTIIMAAPTFLRTYLKRCEKDELEALDLVIVGAEKMPLDLAEDFEEKFGVAPSEGYGATELSPIVAVNVPAGRSARGDKDGVRLGTVGKPLPGVRVKVVDPETWQDLGSDTEGLLLVKGPNVMQGYLNNAEKTAAVIRDGWYNTGDFGKVHAEGFVEITGRQSRFSKIGGEMVPHVKLEEILTGILRPAGDDEEAGIVVAVTSVPDEKKGERLVVVHKPQEKTPDEILAELARHRLPNLWLPSRDSFIEVDEIPILGSGKLDLRALKELALERLSASPSPKETAEK